MTVMTGAKHEEDSRTAVCGVGTAAVITAAGLSSRMNGFKQLLPVQGEPMLRHGVRTFLRAGIREIIVVTGFRAADCREALRDLPVRFVHNPEYASTQMFESACLGLRAALDRGAQAVFVCPADVPLFREETIHALLAGDGPVRIPSKNGRGGHPVLLERAAASRLLTDSGEGGMKGAIRRAGLPVTYIPVTDEGAFHDADTRGDYDEMLRTAADCSGSGKAGKEPAT